MRWIAAVTLLAACDGAGDPSPASGDSGPIWVDAGGDEVPGIVQLGELAYVDDGGAIWTLDPWAESPEDAFGSWATSHVLYASSDCSDPWAESDVAAPGFVNTILGADHRRAGPTTTTPPADDTAAYYVVDDTARMQTHDGAYTLSGGSCEDFASLLTGIPLSDMRRVQLPDLSWLPPVHPDL